MSKNSSRRKSSSRKSSQPLARSPLLLVGLLIAVAAIVYLVSSFGGSSTAGLPASISVQEAYQKYSQGTFLLDVRTQEEWNEYHAPDTTLIPLDELPARLSELPRDKEIVVVCRSGNRSQQGRDILLDAGFMQVTSMDGGLKAWRDAGYPTTGQ